MDIENFIAEFKKTFVYDLLSMTLKDEQLFEHMVDGDAVLWFKEQTRQMWLMWEKAKVQAVPEGFVVLKISDVREILSNASDAICDEKASTVFSETGSPSTWYDHHLVAEKNILDAIEAQEQSHD